MITSLAAEAVEQTIVRQVDIIASLTVEVLQKTSQALKRGEGDPLCQILKLQNKVTLKCKAVLKIEVNNKTFIYKC